MNSFDTENKNNRKLKTARRRYKYNYTYIPSIAMVDKLPRKEYPSMIWFGLVAEQVINILINTLITTFNKLVARCINPN